MHPPVTHIIYHSADLDGKCSAAIAQYLPAPAMPRVRGGAAAVAPKVCPICQGSGLRWAVYVGRHPITDREPCAWEKPLSVSRVACRCKGNTNAVETEHGFESAEAAHEYIAACEFMKTGVPA